MIFELQQADYKKVYPLVTGKHETKVLMLSVLSGNNAGKIFVDDINAPKTAFVWVIGNASFFVGDSGNAAFLGSLNDFIDTTIAPLSKELVGPNSYFETLVYDKGWLYALNKVFQQRDLAKYGTDNCDYMFTFNKERYLLSKERQIALPDGYVIEKISKDTITNDTSKILQKDIRGFWMSEDKFLKNGFGYCIIKDNKAVAVCFSAYVHEHYHEIAIRTYVQEERRKGLATIAARAYIDECIRNELTPAWSTQHTNTVSRTLAEKLGFEFYCKLPSIVFPFYDFD
ncbi:MAG: GNAT family N-acetyltransferase [Firmicutes bacterium]|nr:GNAT family N-acetyltransferase [Bacillota bacterium]